MGCHNPRKKKTRHPRKEAYRGSIHPHVKGPMRAVVSEKGTFFFSVWFGCCGSGQSLGTEGRFERRDWLETRDGSFKGLQSGSDETVILCDRYHSVPYSRLTVYTKLKKYSTRHLTLARSGHQSHNAISHRKAITSREPEMWFSLFGRATTRRAIKI